MKVTATKRWHGRYPAERRTSAFVMDNSVTMAMLFSDELSSYARDVEITLRTATAVVPSLWHLEVVNALLIGERRKRITVSQSVEFLEILKAFPIIMDQATMTNAFGDIIILGRTYHLSGYDAAYLELALRRGLPLATLDVSLRKAAKEVGLSLYLS